MDRITISRQDAVAVVRLNRGVTHAVDLAMVNDLSQALEALAADADTHAMVLASANDKFFSIGFDIPSLLECSVDDFGTFYRSFNRLSISLFTFPKPVIAAITGHAIAGGCILALCCDYRLIAQGRKLMGLNEVKLGVPIPYPADHILRELVGTRVGREICDRGEFYLPEASLHMGMVDEVLAVDKVLPAAVERARLLGAMPGEAFTAIKRNRVQGVAERILARLDKKDTEFIRCWYSADARQLLKEACASF